MFERKEEPPQALIDLAKNHTSGDVSARRHQASRARVLDRWSAPSRKGRMILGIAVGSLALSTAAFAGLKEMRGPGELPPITTTAKPIKTAAAPSDTTDHEDAPEAPAVEAPVTITVEPESAKVVWDGTPLEGSPATLAKYPGNGMHRVSVSAVGYEPKSISVITVDPKVEIHVKLNPLPIVIGEIMSSNGVIANTDEVIEGMRDRFRDCYTEGLALDPTITGKGTLSLEVSAEGKVHHSDVVKVEGLSTKVTTCLAYAGSDAEFDPSTHSVMLRVPLSFGVKE